MKFPMILISNNNVEKYYFPMDYVLFDKFWYCSNQKIIEDLCLNHIFCDYNGSLHQVVGIEHPTSFWRRVFKFLPNTYKCTLKIKPLQEKMSLEDIRKFMLHRTDQLHELWGKDGESFISDWQAKIKSGKTYAGIIDVHFD